MRWRADRMTNAITRPIARGFEKYFRWIDEKQPLNERRMSGLIDWTIRNTGLPKDTSVCRDHDGSYIALTHFSDRAEDVLLWTPSEGISIHQLRLIDQSKPAVHDGKRTTILTNRGKVTLRRFPRQQDPFAYPGTAAIMAVIETTIDPAAAHWSFVQTQGGDRYAFLKPDLFANPNDPSEPTIYTPITDRGRFLPRGERATAAAMREEYGF